MRTSSLWIRSIFFGIITASCLTVFAQEQKPLEKIDDNDVPTITIKKPDEEKKITEKRVNGKVTEVRVKSGKSTYILKPNDPAGSAQRGDGQTDDTRPALWPILEFGGPKKTAPDDVTVPAPPTPKAPPPNK